MVPSEGRRRNAEATAKHLQLKITLEENEPAIWRRVLVPTDITLDHLHRIIQMMFEWYDYHLYEFEIHGKRYQAPDAEAEGEDSTRTRLSDFVWSVGDAFRYTYDFGDDWLHKIEIEPAPQRADRGWLPYLLDGARRGPPEDWGVVDGGRKGAGGAVRSLEPGLTPDAGEGGPSLLWAAAGRRRSTIGRVGGEAVGTNGEEDCRTGQSRTQPAAIRRPTSGCRCGVSRLALRSAAGHAPAAHAGYPGALGANRSALGRWAQV